MRIHALLIFRAHPSPNDWRGSAKRGIVMITYQAGSILQVAIALAVISQRLRSCICENNTNILRKSGIAAQGVILVPRKSIVIFKHIFFFFFALGRSSALLLYNDGFPVEPGQLNSLAELSRC